MLCIESLKERSNDRGVAASSAASSADARCSLGVGNKKPETSPLADEEEEDMEGEEEEQHEQDDLEDEASVQETPIKCPKRELKVERKDAVGVKRQKQESEKASSVAMALGAPSVAVAEVLRCDICKIESKDS
jgi:hypothetical protein